MELNFICIGVQKGGTTSLINYMNQHPEIYMCKTELHYFDSPEFKTLQKLKISTDKLIVGEKTPSYNYLFYALRNIHTYNPNMKLILLLREPISRAYSNYNMNLNFKHKSLSDVTDEEIMADFEADEHIMLHNISCNGNYYIARGKYDEILEYIYSLFPRENVYVGISEQFKNNKQKYNEIFQFLGCSTIELESKDEHIRSYTREIPECLKEKLLHIYRPHVERLYSILGYRVDEWKHYFG
jgi:hypothetical protein